MRISHQIKTINLSKMNQKNLPNSNHMQKQHKKSQITVETNDRPDQNETILPSSSENVNLELLDATSEQPDGSNETQSTVPVSVDVEIITENLKYGWINLVNRRITN